jgi:hypothetical protein
MKRLMIMRRIKQNSEGLYDEQNENTLETLTDEVIMQQKRPYQRISSPPYRDLFNERNVRSNKRGEELDLSGSRKDCTSLCSNE